MIKIDMPWSGSRELDAADGSIALVKDEFKDTAYGWIIEVLTRSTQDLERKEAKEYWMEVTGREATLALFKLARHIWEDNLCDVPQIASCTADHVNQVDDLDWSEFSITPKEKIGSKVFEYDLVKPVGDLLQIRGSLPTLGQLYQIERNSEGDESAFNELLRMCCKANEKVLTLLQIQKIGLVDRKRIRHQLNGEERTLIDTRFKRQCAFANCRRTAYGALDFRSFF